jgi:RNA polymerase sigma-70 factor, ECF subfamily
MRMLNTAVLEDWSVVPDETVVARILDGQVGLFAVLMRRHNQRLYRTARAILRDDAAAEDAMEQAYVSAYAQLRQFDGRVSFAMWLTRIAISEANTRYRG